jgi:DNA primase
VQNVVAAQGTAFTDKQALILKRYAEEVVLCFDADGAGRKAAERSLPALLGLDLGVRVIELPPGEDPDSLIRGQGAEAFVSRVKAARDYFDYQVDAQAGNPEFATPRGKVKFARALAVNVQLINDRLLREAVAGRVATRLGMPLSDFWTVVNRSAKSSQSSQYSKPASADARPGPQIQPLAATQPIGALTLLALGDPEIRRWIVAQPWSPRLAEMEGAELLVKILDSEVSLEEPGSLAAFCASLDEAGQALLGALLRERLPENRIVAAQDCWNAIEKREMARRREVLLARMRDPNLSAAEITEIQKQILDLQKLITDISRPLSPSGLE